MSKKEDTIQNLLNEFRKEQDKFIKQQDEFKKERDEFIKQQTEFRKKNDKKNKRFVILVVTLFFIFIGTTYAASQMLASDVNFTPRDTTWNVNNTEAAINDLYYKIPGIPTGTILSFMGTTAPTGYVICDGTEYNISSHINLANFIKDQFGSYDYFGGDGTTTFAVPDLRGEFLRGTGTNNTTSLSGANVGQHTNEGLPNITGNFGVTANGARGSNMSVSSASGAFYSAARSGWRDGYTDGYNSNTTYYAEFNASRSSSIYGSSTHVTPTNTSVLYIIKY